MAETSVEQVLDLIGKIYDCALDPEGWPGALDAIRFQLGFCNCSILLQAIPSGEILLNRIVGTTPDYVAKMQDHASDIIRIWGGWDRIQGFPLDEPIVHSQIPGLLPLASYRYYSEWLQPQGIIDAVAIGFARDQTLLGSIGLGRHLSAGPIADEEISFLRMIAPHFRRAAVISRLLDLQTVAARTFEATLDALSSGVVFVDEKSTVVHANTAAEVMFRAGSPIAVRGGKLVAIDGAVTTHIQNLVQQAAVDERKLGHRGIGVPLRSKDGAPCVVHVLPLARGDLRPGLRPAAKAALFITSARISSNEPRAALALFYDLTPAETRIFELVADGMAVPHIAETLGVARSTVKTHLLRVFDKTGCHRQADLVRLASSFSIPI